MGCSFSGLNALYDAVNGGGDVWINENRFRILRQLGEGGFAYVYLVKEVVSDSGGAQGSGGIAGKMIKNPSHVSGEGHSLSTVRDGYLLISFVGCLSYLYILSSLFLM